MVFLGKQTLVEVQQPGVFLVVGHDDRRVLWPPGEQDRPRHADNNVHTVSGVFFPMNRSERPSPFTSPMGKSMLNARGQLFCILRLS